MMEMKYLRILGAMLLLLTVSPLRGEEDESMYTVRLPGLPRS